MLTQSQIWLSKDAVLTAKTVRIVPTVFSGAASEIELTEPQRKLVANCTATATAD
jgi:hypothetical protein